MYREYTNSRVREQKLKIKIKMVLYVMELKGIQRNGRNLNEMKPSAIPKDPNF